MSINAAIVDRYLPGASPMHRADARVKMPATIAYIFAVALTPVGHWTALGLIALPLLLMVAVSGLSPLRVLRRSALALPFVLAAVPLLFTREGDTIFSLPVFGWTASREGGIAVATILAKSWISVSAAVVLTATTPQVELVRGLRSMGVPRILAATVSFMYRYIFVIADEALRLMRARDSRSAEVDGLRAGGSAWWRARVLGNMVGSLFLRSFERAERVYAAMQARGYDGEPRFLETPPWRLAEIAAALVIVLYAVVVQVYAHY